MKTRFYIAACVFFSFCFSSCSVDDDSLETKSTSNNLKIEILNDVNTKLKDTININIDPEITYGAEGDPVIVRPIRTD
ncbi:hypothetical protein [[Flexibacter] sp. ATCC 35103]|uniref:hypothetical protein n=1 Tax=[Flexibacter] sp. ATCC 35103 TaxID=1937528 RepID=UPI0009C801C3|nr:hypothetical protein [[Flexibacter] sp. ATCC 35103]OMQ08263.1 hypothetical protein BXU01_21720 [[Flexibacter] sp. ATCC 35103]